MQWRCPIGDDIILEAQLAQYRPAAWHQPFATRLVAGKGLLVEDDDPQPTPCRKERSRGPRRASTYNGDIGVDALVRLGHRLLWIGTGLCGPHHALRTGRCCRGASRLARHGDLRGRLTLRPARQACADHLAPTLGARGGGSSAARNLAKGRLPPRVAPFRVGQVGDRGARDGTNPDPQPARTGLPAYVLS